MPGISSTDSLTAFRERAFSKHVLFDLLFPVFATLLVIALNGWLMHGKVSNLCVGVWCCSAIGLVGMRAVVERHLRRWFKAGVRYSLVLKIYALLAIPVGAISGSFATLYFDAQDPTTVIVLGTCMAVV